MKDVNSLRFISCLPFRRQSRQWAWREHQTRRGKYRPPRCRWWASRHKGHREPGWRCRTAYLHTQWLHFSAHTVATLLCTHNGNTALHTQWQYFSAHTVATLFCTHSGNTSLHTVATLFCTQWLHCFAHSGYIALHTRWLNCCAHTVATLLCTHSGYIAQHT